MFLLFPILFVYKHSCFIYLQKMKLMGMFAWTLMSLIAYLESLLGQSSAVLALQTILTPSMHEDLVIFKPFSQIWLSRSNFRVTGCIDFAPYVQSFKCLGNYYSSQFSTLWCYVLICFYNGMPYDHCGCRQMLYLILWQMFLPIFLYNSLWQMVSHWGTCFALIMYWLNGGIIALWQM